MRGFFAPPHRLAVAASAASSGSGSNYQLLTTGIDAALTNNTSGTSDATWMTGQAGTFSQFMRVDMSVSKDHGVNFALPERTKREVWVAWNRRHNGNTAVGPKELKIFGLPAGNGVNCTLIGPGGYGGGLSFDYGDSATGANDNGISVFFGDTQATWPAHASSPYAGRSTPKPTIGTHLGDISVNDNLWHEYEVHYKKNSVGTQDGAIELKIDGVLWWSMTNCWDNNDLDIGSGGGYIDNIGIGQYIGAVSGLAGVSRDYYNWRISYSGWMT